MQARTLPHPLSRMRFRQRRGLLSYLKIFERLARSTGGAAAASKASSIHAQWARLAKESVVPLRHRRLVLIPALLASLATAGLPAIAVSDGNYDPSRQGCTGNAQDSDHPQFTEDG